MIRPRIRLGLLCIITLPIFVVATFELIFSFYVADEWWYSPQDRSLLYNVYINRGRVLYSHTLGKYYSDDGLRGWQHDFGQARQPGWLDKTSDFTTVITFLGFEYLDEANTKFRVIIVPLWPIALLSAIPTTLWIRRRRSPKLLPGHCRQCGYDLRASKDRCPECGAMINAGIS